MKIASYACTAFPGLNKLDKIKPDQNGYRRQIMGGFNLENESGIGYPLTQAVKNLFENTGLMRARINKGMCYGEDGHPKIVGLSNQQAVQRLASMDEDRQCVHIASADLEEGVDEHGRKIVLVYSRVKAEGNRKHVMQSLFDNPEANVAFSVRSFCDPVFSGGKLNRIITEFLTYDRVPEPGIRDANRFRTAALENMAYDLDETSRIFMPEDFDIERYANVSLEAEVERSIKMVRTNLGWQKIEICEGITSTKWR